MTENEQMENKETTQALIVSAGEPRVTEKAKSKRVAVGRVGAAVRKAKQERLFKELRASKESFRSVRATARLPVFF